MSSNLILHWSLDGLNDDSRVADSTKHHLDGILAGNPEVVSDEKFGSCLKFDGVDDSITVAAAERLQLQSYTAEVWIKVEQTNSFVEILRWNFSIGLSSTGHIQHHFHVNDKTQVSKIPDTESDLITWGQWHHVAITNDGQTARTYIDGNSTSQGDVNGVLSTGNTNLVIGRTAHDIRGIWHFKGCMAHVRLYDGALTEQEIRRDMQKIGRGETDQDMQQTGQRETDQDMQQEIITESIFVRSPIDFNLHNEDNYHVLYIGDYPNGQTLTLDIFNTSKQVIELDEIGQTATPQNHHFALWFRPGALASTSVSQISVATADWSLAWQERGAEGTVLYLLHQGATTLADQTLSLQLAGIAIDSEGGTRGTRVKLETQHLHYAGSTELLAVAQLQYLDLVNYREQQQGIPLHIGLVGGDTVLSDGRTSNTLRIRITNLSRDKSLKLDATSQFKISFDIQGDGEDREWALIDHGAANNVTLPVIKPINKTDERTTRWPDPTTPKVAQTVEWTVSPGEDTQLARNGYMDLEIQGIIAPLSIGQANIYVKCENIPGYQDQLFTLTIRKWPLLFQENQVKIEAANKTDAVLKVNQTALGGRAADFDGRVVIGRDQSVADSVSALSIHANDDNLALWVNQQGSGHAARFEGEVLISGASQAAHDEDGPTNSETTGKAILVVDQQGSGHAANLKGSVLIGGQDKVTGSSTALSVEAKSSEAILVVDQQGSGHAADLKGSVLIGGQDKVTGSSTALTVAAQSSSAALTVKQQGSGNAADLTGRVTISNQNGITNSNNGLTINAKNKNAALEIQQENYRGEAAKLDGRVKISYHTEKDRKRASYHALEVWASTNSKSAVFIDQIKDGNALAVRNKSDNRATVTIKNDGKGTSLELKGDRFAPVLLDVDGTAQAKEWQSTSDVALKKDVKPIEKALHKILKLRGVSFFWKEDSLLDNQPNERQIGFIAQEVESVIPELCSEHRGYKSLEYGKLVAVLVEAIKEQQIEIERSQKVISSLKDKADSLEERFSKT